MTLTRCSTGHMLPALGECGELARAAPALGGEAREWRHDQALQGSRRRLIVRFVHGEELELGAYDDRASAHARAQELVQQLSAAEANGEWPEIDGRHLRPAAIVSVDVLVEEG